MFIRLVEHVPNSHFFEDVPAERHRKIELRMRNCMVVICWNDALNE